MHPVLPLIVRKAFPILEAAGVILFFISRLPQLRRRTQESPAPQDLVQLNLSASKPEDAR